MCVAIMSVLVAMNFYRQRQGTVKMSRVSVISNITVCPVKTVQCCRLK